MSRSPCFLIFLAMTMGLSVPVTTRAQNLRSGVSNSIVMAVADSAFNRGNFVRAKLAYVRILKTDPNNSRAAYQLGRLMPPGSEEAILFFRRYVLLEPQDPWGHMALGDALAKAGRLPQARRFYEHAIKLTPKERDVWIGLGRILQNAGRTDETIKAFERWSSAHPSDALAWRELGRVRQRAGQLREATQALKRALTIAPDNKTENRLRSVQAQAAPAVMPLIGSSWDSDGNVIYRGEVSGTALVFNRARLGVQAGWTQTEDPKQHATALEFTLTGNWRPRGTLRLNGRVGFAEVRGLEDTTHQSQMTPVFHLRARWQAPANGPAGELRLTHTPIMSTPFLLVQPVVLKEGRSIFSAPVYGPIRIRGLGRLGLLKSAVDRNTRIGYGGALTFRIMPGLELSGQYQAMTYKRTTQAGYFAPDLLQTVEVTSYFESSRLWPVEFALDIGIGIQRVTPHDSRAYSWGRAFRLWALISWYFEPGRQLMLEIEGYDSVAAGEALTPSFGWRYGSALLSLRWGLGS
ncbi:tetratricopeptide repeat protein [candidate division KSB1 bacterium]|nr:tetratricopeptide repeat protein [candidate division KSB1 bacterium]